MFESKPLPGEIYQHYKGGIYRIIGVGKHTETEEEMVMYVRHDDPDRQFWIRPLMMFMETLEKPDGSTYRRFKKL